MTPKFPQKVKHNNAAQNVHSVWSNNEKWLRVTSSTMTTYEYEWKWKRGAESYQVLHVLMDRKAKVFPFKV